MFATSCQKDYNITQTATNDAQSIAETVSLDVATNVAKNYFKNFHNLENRNISEQVTSAENGETYFYLFNFKQGGFLIVSADYREYPILAYDLANKLPTKGDINPGLGMWFTDTRDRIQALRKNQITATKMAIHVWEDLKNHRFNSTFPLGLLSKRPE